MEKKKIIIVGGNAAGPSAAAKAKRVDPNAEVIMFEAGEHISTGTCELPYLISEDIKDYREIVFFDDKSFFEKKGVKVYTKHLVQKIDRSNKKITVKNLRDGNESLFEYDKLILCTGSVANKVPELGDNLQNIFYLKSVESYLKIKKYCEEENVQNILIIGSGYIGLEVADAFRSKGKNILMIDKEKHPMPNSEIEIQHLIEDSLWDHDIEFLGAVEAPNYLLKDNKLIGLKIDGRVKNIDIVIASIGFAPNISLALNANLNMGALGGIKVDNKQKTSDSNIYAAGDNIEVINKVTLRPDYLPIATLAHSQGHVAGTNAAGAYDVSLPVVKNIAVKIFDKTYTSVGLTSQDALKLNYQFKSVTEIADNLVHVMPGSSKVFGKIIFNPDSKLIYGASFYGSNEVIGYSDIISTFIQNKITSDKLSEVSFNYTPPKSPFINLLSILGRKIKKELK